MKSNTKIQDKAMEEIQAISKKAKMFVFMLVDEDIGIHDDDMDITQKEKLEIWNRMNDALLENYGEMLYQVISDIKSERK